MELKEVIKLRKNKYNEDRKNSSFTEFWQGYHEGWYSAYRDLEEIIEQHKTNFSSTKYGKWMPNPIMISDLDGDWVALELHCSLCNRLTYHKEKYCPECGAKMDGE